MRKIYKIVCNTCEDQVKQTSVDTCFLTCEFCGEKPVRIIELVEKQDWLNYPHNLPKEGWYLTYNNVGGYNVSFWHPSKTWDTDWDSKEDGVWVTHYQPLPEPPKGEDS